MLVEISEVSIPNYWIGIVRIFPWCACKTDLPQHTHNATGTPTFVLSLGLQLGRAHAIQFASIQYFLCPITVLAEENIDKDATIGQTG